MIPIAKFGAAFVRHGLDRRTLPGSPIVLWLMLVVDREPDSDRAACYGVNYMADRHGDGMPLQDSAASPSAA